MPDDLWVIRVGERRDSRDSEPQILILAILKLRIETADLIEYIFADNTRAAPENVTSAEEIGHHAFVAAV